MPSSNHNKDGANAGGRTNLKAPEGRYMLHSERADGLVPFNARRPVRLTVAPLIGGAEEGLYAVFNVSEALYVSPFNETHAPPIRRLLFPPPPGGLMGAGGEPRDGGRRPMAAFGRAAGSASPGSEAPSAVGAPAAGDAAPHPLCHAFCERTRDGSDLLVGMANGEVALMSLRAQIKNAPTSTPASALAASAAAAAAASAAASAAADAAADADGGGGGGGAKAPKLPPPPKPPSAAQLAHLAASAAKPTLTAMLNPCDTAYDSSRVVAVAWVPHTDGLRFCVAHASGVVGLYQKNAALVAAGLPKGTPLPKGIPAPHPAPFSHHNLALTQAAATGRSLLSQLSAAAARASGGGAELIGRDRGPALPAHVVAPVALVRVPGGGINDCAFSPDGQRLAVACRDGALRIYDYRRAMADAFVAAEAVSVPPPEGHEDFLEDASELGAPPPTPMSGGAGGAPSVRLGNRAGPNDKGMGLPLPPLPPLPQPHVNSGGLSGGVPAIQLPLIGGFRSYFGGVLCCCWSPDGRYLAAGGEDDSVAVYCAGDRAVVAWGEGHDSWVSRVAFDPLVAGNGVGSSAAAGGLLDPVGGAASEAGHAAAAEKKAAAGRGATAPPGAPGAAGPRTVERQYRIASGGQDCAVCLWDVVIEEDEAIAGANNNTNNTNSSSAGADLRLPPLASDSALPVFARGGGTGGGGNGNGNGTGGGGGGGGGGGMGGDDGMGGGGVGVKRVASSPHVAVPRVTSAAALAAMADEPSPGGKSAKSGGGESGGGGGGGESGGGGGNAGMPALKIKKPRKPTPEDLAAAAVAAHERAAQAHAEARRLAQAEELLVALSVRKGGRSLAKAVAARERAVLAPSARRVQMTVIPPIVQHKLHREPVSDVAFTEEAVLTADHAGIIKCWLRPATVKAIREAEAAGAAGGRA